MSVVRKSGSTHPLGGEGLRPHVHRDCSTECRHLVVMWFSYHSTSIYMYLTTVNYSYNVNSRPRTRPETGSCSPLVITSVQGRVGTDDPRPGSCQRKRNPKHSAGQRRRMYAGNCALFSQQISFLPSSTFQVHKMKLGECSLEPNRNLICTSLLYNAQ